MRYGGGDHYLPDENSSSQHHRCNTSTTTRSKRENERRVYNRNVKAIRTTVYIIGSFFVGLMPLTITYFLVCDDCYFVRTKVNPSLLFFILMPLNTLCVLKTLVNPIIYAARMQDIKVSFFFVHFKI